MSMDAVDDDDDDDVHMVQRVRMITCCICECNHKCTHKFTTSHPHKQSTIKTRKND